MGKLHEEAHAGEHTDDEVAAIMVPMMGLTAAHLVGYQWPVSWQKFYPLAHRRSFVRPPLTPDQKQNHNEL